MIATGTRGVFAPAPAALTTTVATITMITTKLGTLMPQALPSAPEAALRIVRACGDPEVTDNDLQQILSIDSAVSAELLRIVNSPLFGLRRPVTEIEQAVLVLGRRLLRNGALVFIARETLRTQSIVQFDARSYLVDTLRRAVAARLLAVAVGMDADDAFTLGLLQDLGMLALLTAYPEIAPAWPGLRRANPDQRRRREMELFGVTHRQVGKMLAERWQLPDELSLPLAHRHDQLLDDFPAYLNKLCQLTVCADWVAAVYTATDKRLALVRCQPLLAACFNLDRHASSALLAQVPAAMNEAAAALDSRISQQASFEELMVDANRWMIEEHHRGEDGAQNLKTALQERERFAEELQAAFERLAQLAYFDPLTSLLNRRRFDELFLKKRWPTCSSPAAWPGRGSAFPSAAAAGQAAIAGKSTWRLSTIPSSIPSTRFYIFPKTMGGIRSSGYNSNDMPRPIGDRRAGISRVGADGHRGR